MAGLMKEKTSYTYAPLRWCVVLLGLLAVLLLAAGVCVIHGVNAVSLRGVADSAEYRQVENTGGQLVLSAADHAQERTYMLYRDGEKNFGLHLADPWTDRGILHIEGTLLRIDQQVGEIRVRVGLLKEDKVILLNTQMVRRFQYAGNNGYDDHCGFAAAAIQERLLQDEALYQVVLVDETDGEKRMIYTGMTLGLVEGRLMLDRENLAESEKTHVE